MKTIALKKPSSDLKKILDDAVDEDVLIEMPDGESFLMCHVSHQNVALARQHLSKSLIALMKERSPATPGPDPSEQAFLQLARTKRVVRKPRT